MVYIHTTDQTDLSPYKKAKLEATITAIESNPENWEEVEKVLDMYRTVVDLAPSKVARAKSERILARRSAFYKKYVK